MSREKKKGGGQNLSNHRLWLVLPPVGEEIGRIIHDILIIRAEYAALGECNDRQYEQHQPRCTHHSRHDGVYDKEPA